VTQLVELLFYVVKSCDIDLMPRDAVNIVSFNIFDRPCLLFHCDTL